MWPKRTRTVFFWVWPVSNKRVLTDQTQSSNLSYDLIRTDSKHIPKTRIENEHWRGRTCWKVASTGDCSRGRFEVCCVCGTGAFQWSFLKLTNEQRTRRRKCREGKTTTNEWTRTKTRKKLTNLASRLIHLWYTYVNLDSFSTQLNWVSIIDNPGTEQINRTKLMTLCFHAHFFY